MYMYADFCYLLTATDGLYSKRFTHKHPLGRPRSLVSEDEKAERRAEKVTRAKAGATTGAAAAVHIAKRGWVRRSWGNRKKRHSIVFVLGMVFVFGPLLGVLLWAMVMHKFDWTPGAGEGY